MAQKPLLKRQAKPRAKTSAEFDDTALLSLSKDERHKLGMDAWEPSLLRQLLAAQNRLKKR